MKRILSTTAIVAAALTIPAAANAQSYYNSGYSAHQQCKKKEDNKQIVGGLIGAVAGGVFGSQVAGSGARTEGSALGAVIGGLAGAGIADKTIDCDPVYPATSQPRYRSSSYETYPAETYPPATYPAADYEETVYGSQSPYYEDRVTVSNHPVYSDPTYGAGAVSQGATYNTGTVSYPPSSYGQTYGTSYGQPAQSYGYTQTSHSSPSYGYQESYSSYRPKPLSGRRHFHGDYVCNSYH